jgi:hypothetical protein
VLANQLWVKYTGNALTVTLSSWTYLLSVVRPGQTTTDHTSPRLNSVCWSIRSTTAAGVSHGESNALVMHWQLLLVLELIYYRLSGLAKPLPITPAQGLVSVFVQLRWYFWTSMGRSWSTVLTNQPDQLKTRIQLLFSSSLSNHRPPC